MNIKSTFTFSQGGRPSGTSALREYLEGLKNRMVFGAYTNALATLRFEIPVPTSRSTIYAFWWNTFELLRQAVLGVFRLQQLPKKCGATPLINTNLDHTAATKFIGESQIAIGKLATLAKANPVAVRRESMPWSKLEGGTFNNLNIGEFFH